MGNEIQKTSTLPAHSRKLIDSLTRISSSQGKMDYLSSLRSIMPGGKPDFAASFKGSRIDRMVLDMGYGSVQKLMFLLVRDFCESFNVVRNMNENQIIECAAMLIDNADNLRIEDYAMFFAGAKKGDYGKVMDHIDAQVINSMLDDFLLYRDQMGRVLRDRDIPENEKYTPPFRPREPEQKKRDIKIKNILRKLF